MNKNILVTIGSVVLLTLALVFAPTIVQAQNPGAASYRLSNTTLNGAINATQTTLVLTAATALAGSSFGAPQVGHAIFIDRELMTITAVSGTTMTVRRDYTQAAAHATGRIVFTGPPDMFRKTDPPLGSCVAASFPMPWINVMNGNVWNCVVTTLSATNYLPITYSSVNVGLH
jgi:hypothetical protein